MNNNVEFLNYVSKNAEMGSTSIKDLINVVEDENFKEILRNQIDEYEKIYEEANQLLDNYNEEQKETNPLQKFTSYIMIKMNLLTNKSTSHIAEMMMKGSNMGIIDIEKKLNSFDNLDKNVNYLGEKLLKIEENNIEQLKPYLKEKE